jgi:phosphoglycerate kinase
MKSIESVDIKEKRVFIRVDFNVPLDDGGHITDDSRIREVLPTIQYAVERKAKVILASHLGRPKGRVVSEMSLAPVAVRLAELIGRKVPLAPDCVGENVRAFVEAMAPGDVLLLENLRFHAEEEKNDDGFAASLAALCDVYVNDAFAVSHRANASVAAIASHAPQSAAGLLLDKELSYFQRAMESPARPLAAVVGGAKVSSKLAALEHMLRKVDKCLIGGAMANTFLKAAGLEVGRSMVENDLLETARDIVSQAAGRGIRFYLPMDVVAAAALDPAAVTRVVPAAEIPVGWMALDIGPATSLLYREVLYDVRTVVWNGPMGVFEMAAFGRGTMAMASAVADAHALTIVGGGDTAAALLQAGEKNRVSYVSTGGGAFLALMEGKTLPAVAALEKAQAEGR